MAKRSTPRPKKKKTTARRRRPAIRRELAKGLAVVALLAASVVAAAVLVRTAIPPAGPERPPAALPALRDPLPPPEGLHHRKVAPLTESAGSIPPFEIYPKEETPAAVPPAPGPPERPSGRPRVAIIIDDLGYDFGLAKRFLSLDPALTVSVLPQSPFGRKIVERARQRGMVVMLHLPMEPREYPRVDPGPGALLTRMGPDQLIARLDEELDRLPGASGVNNHMGSRLTADADRMNQVFSVLKRRGLFYIDSRTTSKTVTLQAARLFQVPFAQRDVFLDHVEAADRIRDQLRTLVRHAEAHGAGIGIAHPHEETFRVLRERLPELKRRVELVPASRLVRVPG